MAAPDREEGSALALDFAKLDRVSGVVPVAVQDADSREVVLYSTSRREPWEKGATSGCRFSLEAAYVNCEQNSLLYLVRPFPEGARHGICHTRNARGEPRRGCFYRRIDLDTLELRNENP